MRGHDDNYPESCLSSLAATCLRLSSLLYTSTTTAHSTMSRNKLRCRLLEVDTLETSPQFSGTHWANSIKHTHLREVVGEEEHVPRHHCLTAPRGDDAVIGMTESKGMQGVSVVGTTERARRQGIVSISQHSRRQRLGTNTRSSASSNDTKAAQSRSRQQRQQGQKGAASSRSQHTTRRSTPRPLAHFT